MSISNTLILVRTHYFDADLAEFVGDLVANSGCRVAVVADETKCQVDVPYFVEKVHISEDWAIRNELITTNDTLWRCGDYFAYAGYKSCPDADYYWLIEDDVRINANPMRRFFERHQERATDFLALKLVQAWDDWPWYQQIKSFYDKVDIRKCMFPALRLSQRAVIALMRERIRIAAICREEQRPSNQDWPNDEGFCATASNVLGLTASDINTSDLISYTDQSFSWKHRTFLPEEIIAMPPDGLIYHPVRRRRGTMP